MRCLGHWPLARCAALAVAAAAIVTLAPAPLEVTGVRPVPAGWSAAFARLDLEPGARVLVVPISNLLLTNSMRWQATAGTDISLIGGYFMGPNSKGRAAFEGRGPRATARYLDWLWLNTPYGQHAVPRLPAPVELPSKAVVRADLAHWRPAAVVAEAGPRSRLGRYLTNILGPPTVHAGSMLGWQMR